jgi:A/G-specific adenine glycosylase
MINQETKDFFIGQLYLWARQNHRPLPWKKEADPYLIWLSEIILQQTRVEQGLPYYNNFKNRFPNVLTLADAPEDEVLKLWQGLGYYSRARNLHYTAKFIAREYKGKFPETYEEIRMLKGVGPYTAAAIASFAYQLPHAVVDGNVSRVLSRFLGIDSPIDSHQGKQLFQELASTLLDTEKPGKYNQRLMDFGATHCTPRQPKCSNCPLQQQCFAFQNQKTDSLPVKGKKLTKTNRYFHYFVFRFNGQTLIRKRIETDIWKHLYEFPMLETDRPGLDFEKIRRLKTPLHDCWKAENLISVQQAGPRKHQLTHQSIIAHFWKLELKEITPEQLPEDFICINWKNLDKFAFPRIIDWYLKDNSLNLFSQLQ